MRMSTQAPKFKPQDIPKDARIAIVAFAVATCLATPANARYFEFYNCGKAQPFVRHDFIKDRNPKTGEWTGKLHSEFGDVRPSAN